ncbi:MAG: hypothetical protein ACD_4C00445G0003 [uncultured bacterium (gcode 4)]|uniref:Uncharacterized protein n=1 Tax=uncultured bacterium (gcode 4) TaxID=1234023 RepID=K2FW21_9BACT|nr:MAG: hypothetical protein ACD_4C00445G0003 [uncultured bacterium (gcode 4)]
MCIRKGPAQDWIVNQIVKWKTGLIKELTRKVTWSINIVAEISHSRKTNFDRLIELKKTVNTNESVINKEYFEYHLRRYIHIQDNELCYSAEPDIEEMWKFLFDLISSCLMIWGWIPWYKELEGIIEEKLLASNKFKSDLELIKHIMVFVLMNIWIIDIWTWC